MYPVIGTKESIESSLGVCDNAYDSLTPADGCIDAVEEVVKSSVIPDFVDDATARIDSPGGSANNEPIKTA